MPGERVQHATRRRTRELPPNSASRFIEEDVQWRDQVLSGPVSGPLSCVGCGWRRALFLTSVARCAVPALTFAPCERRRLPNDSACSLAAVVVSSSWSRAESLSCAVSGDDARNVLPAVSRSWGPPARAIFTAVFNWRVRPSRYPAPTAAASSIFFIFMIEPNFGCRGFASRRAFCLEYQGSSTDVLAKSIRQYEGWAGSGTVSVSIYFAATKRGSLERTTACAFGSSVGASAHARTASRTHTSRRGSSPGCGMDEDG